MPITARGNVARMSPLRQGERTRDEVYRQMFRLEERCPGAEIDLALALLRAWLAAVNVAGSRAERIWLKKISPICLQMIEEASALNNAAPVAK